MTRIGPPPRGAVITDNISKLQLRAWHRPCRLLQPSLDRVILQLCQRLKGAHGILDRFCRDMGVLSGGRKLGVAQKYLNDANIGIGFQQMRGKAVPQRVQRRWLGYPRHMFG